MARIVTSTVDAVLDRAELLFDAQGAVAGARLHYAEVERDDAGRVTRQQGELTDTLTEEDLTAGDRAAIAARLGAAAARWRRRRRYD